MALTRINNQALTNVTELPSDVDLQRPVVTAKKASSQDVSRNTWTKVTGFTVDEHDSHSAWDGSKFTVPSGQAGRYLVTFNLFGTFGDAGNDGENFFAAISVNGTREQFSGLNMAGGGRHMVDPRSTVTMIYDLAVSDYVEFYAILSDDSASGTLKVGGNSNGNNGASAISIARID